MKNIIRAFTLIELVVGITVSMLLMVSVGIFVSSGMQSIFNGQKVLENTDGFNTFSNKLHNSFNLIQSGAFQPESTLSGVIFKRGVSLGDGGFSYIGEVDSITSAGDGYYCLSGSEDVNTKHMILKNFIPFEEQGEDIFNDYDEIIESEITVLGNQYKSLQKEHTIVKKNGSNWYIVIGKGIFGDKFTEGDEGTDIYLNSPTGLAKDGNLLYISDTLNNRILYYDITTSKIYKLLDETDGLNEPTGLYYEDNSLYIANSGNGEILKYSSKETGFSPALTMTGFTINNVAKIEVTFSGASNNVGLTTSNTSNFLLTNPSTSTDYLTSSTNYLKYYLVNYNSESSQGTCSSNEIDLISDNPVQCTSSGTGRISSYQTKTISSITITNIDNTSNTGNYFIDLKLLNSSNNILYQDYFHYFTQSDNDLTTTDDNILTIHKSGLNYPTGIWGTGNGDYNDFGDGTYSNLTYHSTDNLLNVPINTLNISNPPPNDLLTILLKYYRRYNCYNLDDNNERTFLLNKNLK